MELMMAKSPERRRDDPRLDKLNDAVSSLKQSHASLNVKLDAVTMDVAGVKRDTAAIIEEFVDRRNRAKALTFYSRTIECVMRRIVRPLVLVLVFIAIPIYVLAAGHLPVWFKELLEYLK